MQVSLLADCCVFSSVCKSMYARLITVQNHSIASKCCSMELQRRTIFHVSKFSSQHLPILVFAEGGWGIHFGVVSTIAPELVR